MKKQDKEILMSWVQNTSTKDVHDVFLKLGYREAKQIVKSIIDGAPEK